MGELIGTATPEKNGLMSREYVAGEIILAGLLIDYNVDSSTVLYTSSSLIEVYVYAIGNVAYYRVLACPISPKIIIKYIGINYCDFKFKDDKLYVLPKSTDITIKYKYSLGRMEAPAFYSIPVSDFSSITGDIITPTAD